MIDSNTVRVVLESLGSTFLIDTVRGTGYGPDFALPFDTLSDFLVHPTQEFVDRITGDINTSGIVV